MLATVACLSAYNPPVRRGYSIRMCALSRLRAYRNLCSFCPQFDGWRKTKQKLHYKLFRKFWILLLNATALATFATFSGIAFCKPTYLPIKKQCIRTAHTHTDTQKHIHILQASFKFKIVQ